MSRRLSIHVKRPDEQTTQFEAVLPPHLSQRVIFQGQFQWPHRLSDGWTDRQDEMHPPSRSSLLPLAFRVTGQ